MESKTSRWRAILWVGLGAGLMYFSDPKRGRGRRSKLADRLEHYRNLADRRFSQEWHDVSNRVAGMVAEWQSHSHFDPIDDSRLVERVRAKLGRVVSHPRWIEVQANEGRISLKGPCPPGDLRRILTTVAKTRGVRGVVNHLEERKSA